MAALPLEAGFAPILVHRGASQTSDKCSHTMRMPGTTMLSIGLQPAEHLNLKKIRGEVPLSSGKPDLRF